MFLKIIAIAAVGFYAIMALVMVLCACALSSRISQKEEDEINNMKSGEVME